MMRTQRPTRYWSGIHMPLPPDPLKPPTPAVLLAVSDSVTGKGFFFDPLPWMVVAAAVLIISVLFWIPMVRNITRPLARMTRATEAIARGRFDVSIHEPRADEIGRLANAINHMSARLSAFVKGQKRFLGDVSHELGSPVARIQFGLGALEQRIEGDNRERVRDVLEDVEHMSNLVNELLAYSRADLKSDSVKLESINLLPVAQAAVKRETTPADNVNVRIDPTIHVVASADLLTRAIANLIRNAVKYAGDAGPIDVTAERRSGVVEIQIRDSGTGVPEDLLDQLFEPFFRPETSRSRDTGGVGLGLAIVKTCVETCKGSVSAINLSPRGFAVRITLES
jgi:two-component system sensor histidine kinase CpxA